MTSDDPLASIPEHERLAFRAVLVHGNEDATAALHAAGIYDPVALPVTLGTQAPPLSGTPGLTAVLEVQQAKRAAASEPAPAAATQPAAATRSRHGTRAAPSSATEWGSAGGTAMNPVTARGGTLRNLASAPGKMTQPQKRIARIKPHLPKLASLRRRKSDGATGESSAGQHHQQPASVAEPGSD